jgi:3-deoxy-D-manno-octulosonic acid (KDO) 8-phosphate synthase
VVDAQLLPPAPTPAIHWVFDITHSIRKYAAYPAPIRGNREGDAHDRARGVAAGVDGVFIETHPDPGVAKCDAASQLCVCTTWREFMQPLLDLHAVEVRHRNTVTDGAVSRWQRRPEEEIEEPSNWAPHRPAYHHAPPSCIAAA